MQQISILQIDMIMSEKVGKLFFFIFIIDIIAPLSRNKGFPNYDNADFPNYDANVNVLSNYIYA